LHRTTEATFDVIVTNSAGSVTSASATLDRKRLSVITITTQPVSQSVTIGPNCDILRDRNIRDTSTQLPVGGKNGANIAGANFVHLTRFRRR